MRILVQCPLATPTLSASPSLPLSVSDSPAPAALLQSINSAANY